jgi:hypothetical protein
MQGKFSIIFHANFTNIFIHDICAALGIKSEQEKIFAIRKILVAF